MLLAAGGIALGFAVDAEVAALVGAYGVITAAYSLVLKRLVILDVMTIASLFILRVVAGAVAVGAHASEFLLICTGMLALFLGFTKRRQEAMLEEDEPLEIAGAPATRPVLEHYSLPFLDQMIAMVTASAILSLRDLRGRLAAGRLEDARHGALGPLRDLPLPLPDLRPPRHPLDRGDPDRGPGDAVRRASPGSARRWRCSTSSTRFRRPWT